MKTAILQDFDVNNNLPGELEVIFRKLGELVEDYCRRYDNDVPYWYNERANVSFLAGAIWRCGGMALEEFRSPKPWEGGEYTGRTDLWFLYNNKSYIAEAKLLWIDLPSHPDQIAENTKLRLDAAIQAVRGSGEACDQKLAIVFVVPRMKNNDPDQLEDLITLLRTRSQQDVLAPIFLEGKTCPKEKTWEYPGVIVLVRKVH